MLTIINQEQNKCINFSIHRLFNPTQHSLSQCITSKNIHRDKIPRALAVKAGQVLTNKKNKKTNKIRHNRKSDGIEEEKWTNKIKKTRNHSFPRTMAEEVKEVVVIYIIFLVKK